MAKKLPENLSSMFSDSPLRSTTEKERPVALVEAPKPLPPPAEPEVSPVELVDEVEVVALEPVAEVVPSQPAVAAPTLVSTSEEAREDSQRTSKRGKPVVSAAPKKKAVSTGGIKRTFYIAKAHEEAIEAEVYRRRMAGERVGGSDVMHEILDGWLAGKRR